METINLTATVGELRHAKPKFAAASNTTAGNVATYAPTSVASAPTAVGEDVATLPAVLSAAAVRFGRRATKLADGGCKLGGFHHGLN